MATTVYGNTIVSAWSSVLVYTTSETATTYTISVTNVGIRCVNSSVSIYGTGTSGCNLIENITGINSSAISHTSDFRSAGFGGTGTSKWYLGNHCPYTKTINKTASTQSVTISYSCNITKFEKVSGNTSTNYGSYTSTASKTITVPALAKPTVKLDVQRAEDDNTQVNVTATVNSFSGDIISDFTLIQDGVVQSPTWSPTLPVTMSSTSQSFTTSVTTQNENSIPFSLACVGRGGTSSTVTKNLTGAFYTMDIKGGGREIAFGAPATDDLTNFSHGLFKCGMAQRNYIEEISSNVTTSIGTYISSTCYRVGNIVVLYVLFRNTGSTAGGGDIYKAVLSSSVPAPIASVTGCSYYGTYPLPFSFTTSKELKVRNASTSALTISSSSSAGLGFLYITAD